jgi:hypothetical protein
MLYQPDWLIQQMTNLNTVNLPDTCQILEHSSGSPDRYNKPANTWTVRIDPASPDPENPEPLGIPCGIEYLESQDTVPATQTVLIQASLRLEKGTQVNNLDRIKLTHVRGEALDPPQTFNIVGAPKIMPSLVLLDLASVTLAGG